MDRNVYMNFIYTAVNQCTKNECKMLTLSQILPYRRIELRIEHNFDVMDKNYLVSITVVILKNQIMKKIRMYCQPKEPNWSNKNVY